MSSDLETIQVSLKRLLASKDADRESHAKALMVAMHGIQAALAELIEVGERDAGQGQAIAEAADANNRAIGAAADRIASAVREVRVEVPGQPAPIVNVEAPTVNVAAPSVTVQAAAPAVNQITVQAQPDRPRPIRYEVQNEIRMGHSTGKMLITPIYK